jgi:hypothetical protein
VADLQRLFSDLRAVALLLSSVIKHVREERDAFARTADSQQICVFEVYVTDVRFFADQLERELSYLEFLLSMPVD